MPQRSLPQRVLLTLGRPKVGIPLAVALLLIAAPFAYRASRLAGLPDPGHPFDVEAFGTVEISEEENAFIEYEKAAGLLVDFAGDSKELDRALAEGWPATTVPVRQWLEDNRQALQVWKRGTAKPDALYHQPKAVDPSTLLSTIEALREYIRLATLEGSRLAHAGRSERAWEWLRASFRATRHCGRHSGAIQRLIGNATHEMVASAIARWAADPRVNADQLQRALLQVQADYELTQPLSTMIKAEYLTAMNGYDELERSGPSALSGISGSRSGFMNWIVFWLQNEPELSRRLDRQIAFNRLSQVDRPRPEQLPLVSHRLLLFERNQVLKNNPNLLPAEQIEQCLDRAHLSWLPSMALVGRANYGRIESVLLAERARQSALEITLAAQWHDREHGRFPNDAEQLVDEYLPEIPTDPFSPVGEPMHYRRDGDGAVVWSVGENTVDDGGNVENADTGFRIVPPGSQE